VWGAGCRVRRGNRQRGTGNREWGDRETRKMSRNLKFPVAFSIAAFSIAAF